MDVFEFRKLDSCIDMLEKCYLKAFPLNSTSGFGKIEISHIRSLSLSRYSFPMYCFAFIQLLEEYWDCQPTFLGEVEKKKYFGTRYFVVRLGYCLRSKSHTSYYIIGIYCINYGRGFRRTESTARRSSYYYFF